MIQFTFYVKNKRDDMMILMIWYVSRRVDVCKFECAFFNIHCASVIKYCIFSGSSVVGFESENLRNVTWSRVILWWLPTSTFTVYSKLYKYIYVLSIKCTYIHTCIDPCGGVVAFSSIVFTHKQPNK